MLNIFNYFFIVIFSVEMLLKMFALTIRGYYKDNWNVLDFIIVVVSYLGLFGRRERTSFFSILCPTQSNPLLPPPLQTLPQPAATLQPSAHCERCVHCARSVPFPAGRA